MSSSPSPGYCVICSMRRVPLHWRVTTVDWRGKRDSSWRVAREIFLGVLTWPSTSKKYLLGSISGMPPWLRTKKSGFSVISVWGS